MAKRKPSEIADTLAPILVIGIPLLAIIGYLLYRGGVFQSGAPASAPMPAQSASVPQSAAVVTLDAPEQLPQKVTAGEVVPFSFTVQNPGTTSATYPYKVYVKWESGEQDIIDSNTTSLAPGESRDITEALKFETVTTAQVSIEFQDPTVTTQFALPRGE